MAIEQTLDRLLTALDVAPHAFSVCRIQSRWRMEFPVFRMITVHFVLRGAGHMRIGDGSPLPFGPSSVLIVPAQRPHWVGEADEDARIGPAGEQCTLLGDGLVEFTAGNGDGDILLACASVSPQAQAALGLFDLLRASIVDGPAASVIPGGVFDGLLQEIARPGLGTQAICQALMKVALVALLRQQWSREDGDLPLIAAHHPRLARALVAIIENPAADHSVDSLATLAGMSRASFSDHFSRTLGQGPIDFVQKSRLRIAARLLKVTDLPIKVIAESVGYAGSRPFARAFQAAYGLTPQRFRLEAEQAETLL
jgi:AraC family transcriptional activator of mtrCDE